MSFSLWPWFLHSSSCFTHDILLSTSAYNWEKHFPILPWLLSAQHSTIALPLEEKTTYTENDLHHAPSLPGLEQKTLDSKVSSGGGSKYSSSQLIFSHSVSTWWGTWRQPLGLESSTALPPSVCVLVGGIYMNELRTFVEDIYLLQHWNSLGPNSSEKK